MPDCSICLMILDSDIHTTVCDHSFHRLCMLEWMNYNNTCPLCRNVMYATPNRNIAVGHTATSSISQNFYVGYTVVAINDHSLHTSKSRLQIISETVSTAISDVTNIFRYLLSNLS